MARFCRLIREIVFINTIIDGILRREMCRGVSHPIWKTLDKEVAVIRRRFLSLLTAFAGSSYVSFVPGSAAHSAEPLPPCKNVKKNIGAWAVYSDASDYRLTNTGNVSYVSPLFSQDIQPGIEAKNVVDFTERPGEWTRFSFGAGEGGDKDSRSKNISRIIFDKISNMEGTKKIEEIEISGKISLDGSYITGNTVLKIIPSKGLYAEFVNYQKKIDLNKMFSMAKIYKIEYTYQGKSILIVEGSCNGFAKAMELAKTSQKAISYEARAGRCDPKGCIMTTMACNTIGLFDDCFELKMMRHLRDHYVIKQPDGDKTIFNYYSIAPLLQRSAIERIDTSYMARIYFCYVLPGSILTYAGLYSFSYKLMLKMVRKMEIRYLPVEQRLF